jgi:ferrous iron transport protein B
VDGLCQGVGYTVAYFVYTIGTVLTGGTLNVTAAIAGLAAILAMASVLLLIIRNTNKNLQATRASGR